MSTAIMIVMRWMVTVKWTDYGKQQDGVNDLDDYMGNMIYRSHSFSTPKGGGQLRAYLHGCSVTANGCKKHIVLVSL